MITYKIIRFFNDPKKCSKIIRKGLTLEEAQMHCNHNDSISLNKDGKPIWFDGYTKE